MSGQLRPEVSFDLFGVTFIAQAGGYAWGGRKQTIAQTRVVAVGLGRVALGVMWKV